MSFTHELYLSAKLLHAGKRGLFDYQTSHAERRERARSMIQQLGKPLELLRLFQLTYGVKL